MRLKLCVLITLTAAAAACGSARADEPARTDAAELSAMLAEARERVNYEPTQAIELTDELMRRLEGRDDPELRARTLNVIARAQALMSQFPESLSAGEEALRLADTENLSELLRAEILDILSAVHARTNNAGASFVLQQDALEIRTRLGDMSGAASSLATLAELYAYSGRVAQGAELYDAAIANARAANDIYQITRILNNFAFMWILNGEAAAALTLLDEARMLAEQQETRLLIGYTHQNTAHALLKLGRYDEMAPYLETARAIAEEFDQPTLLTGVYFTYARLAFARGELEPAADYAHQAVEQATRIDYRARLADLYDLLARIAAAAGDYETAYAHMARHQEYLASVADAELEDSGALFEAQRELAEQNQELELLRRDAELGALNLANARISRNAALFIAGLMGAVLFVLAAFLREKARAKRSVEAKNRELTIAHDELIRANSAKSHFLSVMSHELKTPLNAVLGFSDIIAQEKIGPIGNGQYVEFARHINAEGGRLLRLLKDILLATDAESGKLALVEDEAGVEDVLSRALKKAAVEREDAGLRVRRGPACDAVILGDAGQLAHAVAKLVDNALKFSPAGSEVTLAARLGADGGVAISISDEGSGLDVAQRPHLLDFFRQADERLGRASEGAGLGLPIAKLIAEAHDGRLALEFAPGGGLHAQIELPAARVITDAPADAESGLGLCA